MLGAPNSDQNGFQELEFCFWVWSSLKIQIIIEFGQVYSLLGLSIFVGSSYPLTFFSGLGIPADNELIPKIIRDVGEQIPYVVNSRKKQKQRQKKLFTLFQECRGSWEYSVNDSVY